MTSPPLLQNIALDILHSLLHPTFCFFPSQMSLSSTGQQCGPHTVLWPWFTTLSCTWQIRGVFSSSSYVMSVAYLFFSLTSMTATLIHFKSRKQMNAQRNDGPSCLTHHSLLELWALQPAVSGRKSPDTSQGQWGKQGWEEGQTQGKGEGEDRWQKRAGTFGLVFDKNELGVTGEAPLPLGCWLPTWAVLIKNTHQ